MTMLDSNTSKRADQKTYYSSGWQKTKNKHVVVNVVLTCNNTGDFGHETFDSSDGHTLCLILDVSDNVFNLQRKTRRHRHS